jgi:hypothetical protein
MKEVYITYVLDCEGRQAFSFLSWTPFFLFISVSLLHLSVLLLLCSIETWSLERMKGTGK